MFIYMRKWTIYCENYLIMLLLAMNILAQRKKLVWTF